MKSSTLIFPARFCGPPNSANGGYAAGRLASFLGDSAEVTLRSPPPLDTPMQLETTDGELKLKHGDRLIAAAHAATAKSAAMVAPDSATAALAAARTFAAADHKLPGCFVCGPGRAPGDGLRIHVGPLEEHDSEWRGTLAAPWQPPEEFADAAGNVLPEFVWAALDCPTAYACGSARGMPPILLGRQTVSILRRPKTGERCVITSKQRHQDGRKHYADATMFGADGQALAHCNTVWIEVSETQLRGGA